MSQLLNTSSKSQSEVAQLQAYKNALKLPVAHKTVGILEGVHPSIFKGIGTDFDEFTQYQPGDNIKHIDWKASARAQQAVVKRFRADANTNLTFILDSSREMITRSRSGERKIDIMRTVCNTFGYLSAMRLDAVGVVAGDEERIMNESAKLGFGEVNIMLDKVEDIASDTAPHRAFGRVLAYCSQFFKKRTFMVIVLDEVTFVHNEEIFISIVRKLKERHDIFVVTIRSVNPFRAELPNSHGRVIDISNHSFMPSYFRKESIARITKKNITKNRKRIAQGMKTIGVPHISCNGTADFYTKLSKSLQRKEVAHL